MKQLSILSTGNLYRVPENETLNLIIELALTTGVRLLVCGNNLPFYEITYILAGRVGQNYETILREHLHFSRAETCIQLVDFLSELKTDPVPLFVTDMLARFRDEDDHRIDELFFECQVELERLSQASLVFLSAKTRSPFERLEHVLARITTEIDFRGITDGSHTPPLFAPI